MESIKKGTKRERSKKKSEYFPTIKKEFEKLQSDTITTGGMLGKYNPTMTIFALKNWCNWKDKAGKYPVETVKTMEEIVCETKKSKWLIFVDNKEKGEKRCSVKNKKIFCLMIYAASICFMALFVAEKHG